MENLDEEIKKAPAESLINYVAIYRSLKINKDIAIKCMIELDERRSNGYKEDFEYLIDQKQKLFSSIGKGFIAKVNSEKEIESTIFDLKKIGVDAILINREECFIYIGNPAKDKLDLIQSHHSIFSIQKDIKVLSSVASSKLS